MESKELHNVSGQINIYQLDRDSYITGYGKHARVVACCAKGNTCYARVDYLELLRKPTDAEIIAVARRDSDIAGRWRVAKREAWNTGDPYFSGRIEREDIHLEKA